MFLHLKGHVVLGSSKPSTTESSCCGRISTRYPFQLKRKNLKDFFGGPPTCQDLMVKCCITQSGSLPHEVSNMDADNAVTYRFYDASHHDEIGLEAFQVMLLKSGASSSNATKDHPHRLGWATPAERIRSSKVAKPALKTLASLNNAKTCTAAALRDLGRGMDDRVRLEGRVPLKEWWQTAPGGGSRMRSRRLGSATQRCRVMLSGAHVCVPHIDPTRQDVSVSLAKLEEAYKPEKQTKAAIWQAISFILFQVMLDVLSNLLFTRPPKVMGVQLYKLEIGNRKPEIRVLYRYSRLIHDLYKKQLLLNRKIPAQIAILNKNCLYMISNKIIK
ncbi:BRCA2, helical [Musa troglodytarum]|uniref:Large ribosomal subunit protein bL20c n=2 Tax=Musa troglodytarum TaxID=320322 RepID=A0A9E7KLS3_9LILI|nr:BRCA2, helical [Musa troglodytarum]